MVHTVSLFDKCAHVAHKYTDKYCCVDMGLAEIGSGRALRAVCTTLTQAEHALRPGWCIVYDSVIIRRYQVSK